MFLPCPHWKKDKCETVKYCNNCHAHVVTSSSLFHHEHHYVKMLLYCSQLNSYKIIHQLQLLSVIVSCNGLALSPWIRWPYSFSLLHYITIKVHRTSAITETLRQIDIFIWFILETPISVFWTKELIHELRGHNWTYFATRHIVLLPWIETTL